MRRLIIFILIALPVTIAYWLGVEYVLQSRGLENVYPIVWTLWILWFGFLCLIYKITSNDKDKRNILRGHTHE